MRIAQLAPQIYDVPPLLAGGTERIVYDLCEALTELGHDVTLFATDGSVVSGSLVPCGPAISSLNTAPPSLPNAREAITLDRILNLRHKFDIIHCHTEFFHAPVLASQNLPTLTTIHWRADECDRGEFLNHFRKLPVVAISLAQRRAMPHYRHDTPVVYHGLHTDRYSLGEGKGHYAAFLGRMTDQKGPDRAIAIAKDCGLPIKLGGNLDIGNPSYFDNNVKSKLSDTAYYIGSVTDQQKQDFLGNASVFLFPINWPEPFGLVMIEAMLCGTPVVASDCGATREIVEDGVTGYVVTDNLSWTNAVRKARTLDRQKVRKRAAERFSRERMAQNYIEAYKNVLNKYNSSL